MKKARSQAVGALRRRHRTQSGGAEIEEKYLSVSAFKLAFLSKADD
jgi:hypothetical protein